jgi:hypothetical protein
VSSRPLLATKQLTKGNMIVKCPCEFCGANLEFEAVQFEKSGETSIKILGQTVECPHCKQMTRLCIKRASDFSAIGKTGSSSKKSWWFVAGWFFLFGLIIFSGWLLSKSDWAAEHLGDGIEAVLGCAAAIFCFILAVYWTIFPILMTIKLNGIRSVMEKIEENTRK